MVQYLVMSIVFVFFTLNVLSQDYTHDISIKEGFNKLSGAPLTSKYGSAVAVKALYEIETQTIYYINSNSYKNHYQFCSKELSYIDGMGNFFKRNYSNGPKRRYLLFNINYFNNSNKYVIDISPIDLMGIDQIQLITKLVKETTYIDELHFLINCPRLRQLEDVLEDSVKTINPSDIYGDLNYQAIYKTKNIGTFRVIEDFDKEGEKITSSDIVLLKAIPGYLPPVAGVIVTEFQTPLSHISILGSNRKIPICAYTKAFTNEQLPNYNGQQVSLTVKADTFLIMPDSSIIGVNTGKKMSLRMNLNVDSVLDIEFVNRELSDVVGNKAANFGELHKVSKVTDFKTPESAFAIPFYYYVQHIEKSKADKLINKLATKPNLSIKREQKLLLKIRDRIKGTPVNEDLIRHVEDRLKSDNGFIRFRFRSSTNAEDIKGFSGAGLYKSKTVNVNSKNKTAEKAIKSVWASLWSHEAFTERAFFGMEQKNVAMGILVHRSFPAEKVNGVALTKNIYRRNSNGFLINAQLGDESVVDPPEDVICDQFICFPSNSNKIYKDNIVIDVITYSSLNGNELIMTEGEIQNLADQLDKIKRHFAGDEVNKWTYLRIGYDVEFKLDGENRQLYIKQIRPFND